MGEAYNRVVSICLNLFLLASKKLHLKNNLSDVWGEEILKKPEKKKD